MPRVTYDEIEAARLARGQKSIADIVTDRLSESPTEKRRKKRILRLHRKLKTALGDEHALLLDLEKLTTERLVEVEKIACEVGFTIGMQLGHQDPPLPPELAHVVEDIATVCADHQGANVDVALAWVLRSRLLAVEGLKPTGEGDERE